MEKEKKLPPTGHGTGIAAEAPFPMHFSSFAVSVLPRFNSLPLHRFHPPHQRAGLLKRQ